MLPLLPHKTSLRHTLSPSSVCFLESIHGLLACLRKKKRGLRIKSFHSQELPTHIATHTPPSQAYTHKHIFQKLLLRRRRRGDKGELPKASLCKRICEGTLLLRLHNLHPRGIKSIQGKSFRSMAVSSFRKVCSFASYDQCML